MRLIDITDFQDPALDVYARISEGQLLNRAEPEKGMFIAESPKVIRRALQAGYQPVSFLVENRLAESNHETRELLEEWEGMDIPIYTAEFDVLTQLTGFMLTRGMLCAMYRKPLPSMEEVCRGAKRIAVLENVVYPTNVGAIFRSAAALGMDAVLLTRACSNPLYRRAIRVSMGTVFQVPWTFADADWESTGVEIDFTYQVGIEDTYGTTGSSLRAEMVDVGNFYSVQIETVFRRGTATYNQVVAVAYW